MPGHEIIGKEEFDEIRHVFNNGCVLFRRGFEERRNGVNCTEEFEARFAERVQSKYSLAVSSGTAALRVALAAIGIEEGDEVITQSFTFVATVEAIIESRATPVCADIDGTLNLCPKALEDQITEKTKAVIVVHMLGSPARIDEISRICREKNIFLIEDTAWGCGGDVDGKPLGTWGDIGTYSFDFAKTITTGEGGMIVTDNKKIWEQCSAWHDHGHENNPAVARWEDTRSSSGFNFRMSELQAAVGLAQLRKLDWILAKQREYSSMVWSELEGLDGVKPREIPKGANSTEDGLILMLESSQHARGCRNSLLRRGLSTKILPEAVTWHFAGYWDHMEQLTRRCGPDLMSSFKKSAKILENAVCIPVSISEKNGDPKEIAEALKDVLR